MAEGWAAALKQETVEAYSAGINPHGLNDRAIKVMAECGVDISVQRSKHVSELSGIQLDFVVTVCDHAHEACPVCPGASMVHVGFDDPPRLATDARTEEEALSHYRRIRDEIKRFVERLPNNLPR